MEIFEILKELGYKVRRSGKFYRTRPIYRDSDNDNSLAIDAATGAWIDFSANIGGGFPELIRLSLGLADCDSAKSWLENKSYVENTEVVKPVIEQQKIFNEGLLKEIFPEHEYWVKRGISEETLAVFNGGICKEGQLKDRYVFPIFNSNKQIIGFSGRDITNYTNRPKWKHLGNVEKWCYPTFLNLRFVKNKEIILIESIGDMLSLWQAGIKNTLVLFGLNLSKFRLYFLLKIFPSRIIIALNNDAEEPSPGRKASSNIGKYLEKYFDKNIIKIHLPLKKDFGEMTTEEILLWEKGLRE